MDLSELLGALRAPGTPDELAHAETTVAAMVVAHSEAAAGVVPLARVDRRPALVAVGATVGIVASVLVAGTAAAAFSGALPNRLQQVAHDILGAPAPTSIGPDSDSDSSAGRSGASEFTESSRSSTASPSGPAVATDAAALFGLCTAYSDHGADDQSGESVAFKVLSAAASAADGQTIEEYCAPILATGKATGRPTVTPSGKPSVAPSRKPTAPPSRKPTVLPAPALTHPTAASAASGAGSRPTATPPR